MIHHHLFSQKMSNYIKKKMLMSKNSCCHMVVIRYFQHLQETRNNQHFYKYSFKKCKMFTLLGICLNKNMTFVRKLIFNTYII